MSVMLQLGGSVMCFGGAAILGYYNSHTTPSLDVAAMVMLLLGGALIGVSL